VLGLEGEIGTLEVGSCADLCLLQWVDAAPAGMLSDAFGNQVEGGRYEPLLTIRAGEVRAHTLRRSPREKP
jgi:predicted amidohydrolase